MSRLIRFLRYNEHKSLTLQSLLYSAIYRFSILHDSGDRLNRRWGREGQESSLDVENADYKYVLKVAYAVNRVCNRTRWESKCLVRALTAQRLLRKKKIPSTLYLGCGLDDEGNMIAHAWLRCGRIYVTGGNGDGYAVVDKFLS